MVTDLLIPVLVLVICLFLLFLPFLFPHPSLVHLYPRMLATAFQARVSLLPPEGILTTDVALLFPPVMNLQK
jgi:hypothetical protein